MSELLLVACGLSGFNVQSAVNDDGGGLRGDRSQQGGLRCGKDVLAVGVYSHHADGLAPVGHAHAEPADDPFCFGLFGESCSRISGGVLDVDSFARESGAINRVLIEEDGALVQVVIG